MCDDAGKPNHLFCHVLSIDPLIIIGYGSPGPFSPAKQLCEALKRHRAYFLLGSWWDLNEPVELSRTVQNYQKFKLAYPHHEFFYMVNEESHAKLLHSFGVPATFCHQNALVDERLYHIQDRERIYDAVYNARLDPFKRHLLARELRSMGLIYYNMAGQEGVNYQEYILRELPQAVPLNMRDGKYKFLFPHDIRECYNQSRVGLCLSEIEGANYATMEYLLCGLPVVSTRNSGGRNHFLSPEFSRIVDPDPSAVRRAVEELIALDIPPQLIRRKTLLNCLAHRNILQKMVQAIYDFEGAGRNFADEWDTVYVNKMLNWGITDWQVLEYIDRWRGCTDKVVEPLRRDRNWEQQMMTRTKAAA
jgi:glycosyltransferase involved in cell wall biosynthesis